MFGVRYRAGDAVPLSGGATVSPSIPAGPLEAMSRMPDSIYAIPGLDARAWRSSSGSMSMTPTLRFLAERALDPSNPFRGNGFGGTGQDYLPELTYGRNTVKVPEGAELWRFGPDGTQDLAAVYRDLAWRPIVEQPLADVR